MSILGDRIKKERENLNLTRNDLANKLGVSYSAIAMYEQGNREPNNELTIKLCQIFNCSMDYLMGLTSYKNPKEDLEKELYKLNLTEDEFDEMISLLIDENNENLDKILQNTNNVALACDKCLNLILDYANGDNAVLHQNIDKLTTIIKSLDKSKIIHNYKNNQENKFYMCPVYGRIAAGQPNWAEECIEGRIPIDPVLMDIINPEECYFLKVNGESMNKVIRNGAYALIRKTDWVKNGEIAVVLVNGYDATLKKFTKQGDLVILEPMSDDPSFETQVYDKNTEIRIIGKYIGKFETN